MLPPYLAMTGIELSQYGVDANKAVDEDIICSRLGIRNKTVDQAGYPTVDNSCHFLAILGLVCKSLFLKIKLEDSSFLRDDFTTHWQVINKFTIINNFQIAI